ncbi:hypothetical protein C289_2640 [Anoxybacillus ayderensis]|nr:hypothetical protein AF2641_05375 [Anoxybacillus flavithermus]EPZ37334.1 hypothetical protein C289_2640 [Anoxybacillus ayderensis]
MLNRIDLWIENDISHFNVFVGIILIIFILSTITIVFLNYKLGKKDERKNLIQLKVSKVVCISLIVFLCFYLLTAENDLTYEKQYLTLGISLSLFSGAIACIYYYVRERFF